MSTERDRRSGSSTEQTDTLPKRYAELIIDALVDARLVRREDFDEAVRIAELEITVRRSMGDR